MPTKRKNAALESDLRKKRHKSATQPIDAKAEAEAKSLSGQVQLDTPAQGDCLFWAVMLGALIRANGTEHFETVVSRLFGGEWAAADAKQLSEVLLPSYQGRVSDITAYSTTHAFNTLMMRFRARVANHIRETSALHQHIEGDAKAYGEKMSQAGTWGGEIEIKAMAALLGIDIIVHRDTGLPMYRMPAVAGEETPEALHIAHVPASAGSSVQNHYHFYVLEGQVSWSREVSAVEKAARDAYAEYQTWRLLSYPVMNLLGTLLQSRLPNQPSDDQFDRQILWLLVTGNMNHLAESKSTSVESVADMFVDKYNRGNQGFFESSRGQDAQFPESLWDLLGGLATQVDKQIRPLLYMDPNSMGVMGSFLTREDQSALVRTCKELDQTKIGRQLRVNKLLSLVAQGRQAEAEVMIEKDPTLLLERGEVTDGAGRSFTGITALQYAVWALDAHMWTMMLPYFDRISARCSAGDQLRTLEEKGLGEHGSHFDFQPLLAAYGAYFARPSSETWCRGVGGQQCLLPDHVIQEYTTPDRPFDPVPDFSVQRGRPGVHGERGVKWWRPLLGVSGSGRRSTRVAGATLAPHRPTFFLGVLLSSYCRWAHGSARGLAAAAAAPAIQRGSSAKRDRAAVNALWTQRERDLSDLLARFDITPRPAPESKSPGRRG